MPKPFQGFHISAIERFKKPAAYVCYAMQHAGYKATAETEITYLDINQPISVIMTDERYKLHIDGKGEISPDTLKNILRCHEMLVNECSYHPIKSSMLNVPMPGSIWVSYYNDAEQWVQIGGSEHKPQFQIFRNGRIKRCSFENKPDPLVEDYVWRLTRYMVNSYSSD